MRSALVKTRQPRRGIAAEAARQHSPRLREEDPGGEHEERARAGGSRCLDHRLDLASVSNLK